MDEVIAVLEKNPLEQIHIRLKSYKGRTFADCRVYFEAEHNKWTATKKGIALSPDLIGPVIEALQKAESYFSGMKLPLLASESSQAQR